MWTTPTDLARFAIETALSKQGKGNHVLSESMTRQMLTVQMEPVGLGFFLGEYKNPQEFGHNGSNEGFRSWLVMFADTGEGVAIMANSDNGVPLEDMLMRSVAKEYSWKYTPEPQSPSETLMLIADLKGPQAAIKRYSELKQSSSPGLDENTLINLGYHIFFNGDTASALQTFKLEVQDYPQFWNGYDSLAEAYIKAGQKDLAIQNYEKSVELNPKNQNGIDYLKKLKEQK